VAYFLVHPVHIATYADGMQRCPRTMP